MEDKKICPICEEVKNLDAFHRNEDGSLRRNVCRSCLNRKSRARAKLAMFAALGRACACCGERHPNFLTLDHIQGKTEEDRSTTNIEMLYRKAAEEGWPRDKYQILCMNCNFAKGHWGACPHERKETADAAYARLESYDFKIGKQYQNFNLEPLKQGPKTSATSEKHYKFNAEASRRANEVQIEARSEKKKQALEDLAKNLNPDVIKALLTMYENKST